MSSKVPLGVLLRAAEALQAAEATPPMARMTGDTWLKVMDARAELQRHLAPLLTTPSVEVA